MWPVRKSSKAGDLSCILEYKNVSFYREIFLGYPAAIYKVSLIFLAILLPTFGILLFDKTINTGRFQSHLFKQVVEFVKRS